MSNEIFHIPSLTNLSAYKSAVYSIKDLSAEEEKILSYDYINNNSLHSAQKLILSQLKTVVKIALEFSNYGLATEDLIQEGNIGLMKAVKNFDPNKGYRLYTFSIIWIKSEIQNYILNNWKIFKIGSTKELKKLFFNYRSLKKNLKNLGFENEHSINNEIAKKLNVSIEDTKEAQKFLEYETINVDNYENNDIDDYFQYTPTALIEYKNPEYYLIKKDKSNLLDNIINIVNTLPEKEKLIIQNKYLTNNKKTNKELAKILNISAERVRQIEEKTIEIIKNKININ